jgi:hypothetical protein
LYWKYNSVTYLIEGEIAYVKLRANSNSISEEEAEDRTVGGSAQELHLVSTLRWCVQGKRNNVNFSSGEGLTLE